MVLKKKRIGKILVRLIKDHRMWIVKCGDEVRYKSPNQLFAVQRFNEI